ncbi:MAG: polyprenyl synthetase family protein [Erysipelotrichaceae bacterium]|nr:polyprenyl synthetase family protein [Erysipelotrichaceae bacterium]
MMNSNFENHIRRYLDRQRNDLILEASRYALEGGKRFRPRIIFAILEGMGIPEEKGYDAAMALEFIQTYSLIHDDLPAMDDDDLRRGKPSLHKAFREDIAILTGDQLLTDSFRIVSESNDYDSETKVNIIKALSTYAGRDGMIYGQLLDVTSDKNDLDSEKLYLIQENKTSGLFKIACLIPMYIAHMDKEDYFTVLGSLIGHIFQNQDDLFDMIKTEEEMGKNLSDVRNDKLTALQFCDVDTLKKLIDDEFEVLDHYLENAPFDTQSLKELLMKLKER